VCVCTCVCMRVCPRVLGVSVSLPVHKICTVCALLVNGNQAHRFKRFVRKYHMEYSVQYFVCFYFILQYFLNI